jgi:regulator of RNase E activity RraA
MAGAQPALAAETIARLRLASTATIASQLVKRGLRRTFMVGPRPLRPQDRMVGTAFTLRYVPAREDLDPGVVYDNETNIQRRAIEQVGPGEVLVIDARGDVSAATLGNILAARLRARGAAGIVTDGAFRDAARIAEEPIPSYCRGAHAQLSSVAHYPADMQVVIGCGGVLVAPGDVLVGDEDGVIVIPRALADEVAQAAATQEALEDFILERVRAGASIKGVYPPDEQTLAEYERWRDRQGPPRS